MAEMPGAYVATGRRACDVIYFLRRELPDALQVLTELALDLRWTWSHAGDALWQTISPETWEQMRNPWTILQDVTLERLEQLAQDTRFMAKLQRLVAERAQYLNQPGWYGRHYRGIGATGRRQPALPARLLSANARCQRQTAGGQVLERVAAGGFGAAGLEWCLQAVNEKAVDLLLVQDEVRRAGRACTKCGWLGLEDLACPVCANPTLEVTDIFDEMETAVLDARGWVEQVRRGTGLDRHAVAAKLRFPVARPHGAVGGSGLEP